MKICMICLGLGNLNEIPLIGGNENTVVRLCKSLHEMGHEITIITTPSIHYGKSQSHSFNVKWGTIYSLAMNSSYGSYNYGIEFIIKSYRKLKVLHKNNHFSLIHGHSGYPVLGLITGMLGANLGIPSVHTLYCPLEGNMFNRYLNKVYLSLLDRIISLSNNTQYSLNSIGIPQNKIEVIPPPIDMSVFNSSIRSNSINQSGDELNAFKVLYVGDLTEKRGLHILIESLANVSKQYPDIKLLLAVNMPLEKYKKENYKIKEMITGLKLDENVIPLGIITNMPEVMASCDAIIAPYLSIETIADYPVSLLEAMACGTPAIATIVGGVPEIIENKVTGLLIEPNNSNQLADSILYLINDRKTLVEMSKKASQYVTSNFSLDVIARKYEQTYLHITKIN